VSQGLLNRANEDENFLKNTITGNELRVYGFDIETKKWLSKGSSWPKKARQMRSNVKVMLTVFSILRALFTMNFYHKARQ
jgi:hypothetical protein